MSPRDAAIHEDREVRAEAEERAYGEVNPDYMLDGVAAVNLYVKAFMAGVEYCNAMRKDGAR